MRHRPHTDNHFFRPPWNSLGDFKGKDIFVIAQLIFLLGLNKDFHHQADKQNETLFSEPEQF